MKNKAVAWWCAEGDVDWLARLDALQPMAGGEEVSERKGRRESERQREEGRGKREMGERKSISCGWKKRRTFPLWDSNNHRKGSSGMRH